MIEGAAELERTLRRAASRTLGEAGDALHSEGRKDEAKVRARTPVETGDLRGTVKASRPKRRGDVVSVEITAGGPAAPYAAAVHEDIEAFHPTGQAKFVESVIMDSRSTLLRRLAKSFDLRKLVR